jgi:hypothetical protein
LNEVTMAWYDYIVFKLVSGSSAEAGWQANFEPG